MNKRRLLAGGVAAALLAGGAAWFGLGRNAAQAQGGGKGKPPEVALEFAPREVVQPTLARLPGVVEFSGPLVAPQTAPLRARAGGTLLALTVSEGHRVQAGQVVGRVELADLASRVAERNANLESARATLAS